MNSSARDYPPEELMMKRILIQEMVDARTWADMVRGAEALRNVIITARQMRAEHERMNPQPQSAAMAGPMNIAQHP